MSSSIPEDPKTTPVSVAPNVGGPPQIGGSDPYAPETHNDGGTYAPQDYSPAAQRSAFHRDQYDPKAPTKREDRPDRSSGFAASTGEEGPASGPGGGSGQ